MPCERSQEMTDEQRRLVRDFGYRFRRQASARQPGQDLAHLGKK